MAEKKQEYVYDKAFNGLTVRIPADKYEAWKAEQEAYKSGKKKPQANPELVAALRRKLLGE